MGGTCAWRACAWPCLLTSAVHGLPQAPGFSVPGALQWTVQLDLMVGSGCGMLGACFGPAAAGGQPLKPGWPADLQPAAAADVLGPLLWHLLTASPAAAPQLAAAASATPTQHCNNSQANAHMVCTVLQRALERLIAPSGFLIFRLWQLLQYFLLQYQCN